MYSKVDFLGWTTLVHSIDRKSCRQVERCDRLMGQGGWDSTAYQCESIDLIWWDQ